MRMSESGLGLTKASEALRLKAYRDGGGVPTIGWGHTAGVKMGQTITREQADAFLRADVVEAEALVNKHAPGLPQAAFDALADFVFNLGPQALHNPKTGAPTGVMRALLAKDYKEVPRQLGRWIFDNGEIQRGLVIRRDAQATLWRQAFPE
jgi:lysozyme